MGELLEDSLEQERVESKAQRDGLSETGIQSTQFIYSNKPEGRRQIQNFSFDCIFSVKQEAKQSAESEDRREMLKF